MPRITFVVRGAEFEFPESFDKNLAPDAVAFLKESVNCPLTFHNFDRDDLEQIFDAMWISENESGDGIPPAKIEITQARFSDSSINFDAKFFYDVELAGEHVDDDFIEENLSWGTDLIDFLSVSFRENDFEELGVGEKIGPSIE
jgi:hypothetical protein